MKYLMTCLIVCVLLAFSSTNTRDSYTVTRVKQDYKSSIDTFTKKLDLFLSIVNKRVTIQEIQEIHLLTRESYKRFEYLISHFDNQAVKKHLNGAPLPIAIFENGQTVAIDPVGLQVIDEMVFGADLNKDDLKNLLLKMRSIIDDIADFESNRYIDESHILIAMREQIIRIITLGLSGYDTPGSLHGIKEAEVSLSQMLICFKYFSMFVDDDTDIIFKEVISAFSRSIDYLQMENDFDNFDRTVFIRDYLNPLSALLLVFHDISGIAFMHEEVALEKGLNQKAFHLFDMSFFNSEAYSLITRKKDNIALQELGASLFYDESLSLDQSMSCATCHNPSKSFADGRHLSISNHRLETTKRNTPSLINSVYSKRYFYDLRAQQLAEQIIQVFSNPNEFHVDFDLISKRLNGSPGYLNMFSAAFSNSSSDTAIINRTSIITALSSYIKTISSFDSAFDQYMRKEREVIDESVTSGFNLFMGKAACGTCHFAPLFNGLVPPDFDENETEVLGVPISKLDTILDDDIGRIGNGWKHENTEHYRYSFKTVSVRNIDQTAPYMHNGIYETLEEVLDFYNHGGGLGIGIDVPHQTLSGDSLHLSKIEMNQIIAFMKSLSDTEFEYIIPDTLPRFADKDGAMSDIRPNVYSQKSH